MTIEEIKKILPHSYPFLLVDRVVEYEPLKYIETIKNVTFNEPFFQGHFPIQSVMPGVLVIEAMAQSGGILSFLSLTEDERKDLSGSNMVYFLEIEKARFRRTVIPGDTLRIHVEVLKKKMKIWKMQGRCFVDDKLVAEAVMTAKVD